MRPNVFRDAELQQRFERFGWVIVPAFDAAECAEFAALWAAGNAPAAGREFVSSAGFRGPDRAFVDRPLQQRMTERLAGIFDDYRLLLCSFLVRQSGGTYRLAYHQEHTYVDDDDFDGVNLWIPLRDIGMTDGIVQVISGSHRAGPAAVRGTDHEYFPYDAMLRAEPAESIVMRAGDALIFSHLLVHQSLPNTSGDERICLAGVGVPNAAQLLYPLQRERGGVIEIYAADDEFYHAHRIGDEPVNLQRLGAAEPRAPLTLEAMRSARSALLA